MTYDQPLGSKQSMSNTVVRKPCAQQTTAAQEKLFWLGKVLQAQHMKHDAVVLTPGDARALCTAGHCSTRGICPGMALQAQHAKHGQRGDAQACGI